jgi:hypothetical protein
LSTRPNFFSSSTSMRISGVDTKSGRRQRLLDGLLAGGEDAQQPRGSYSASSCP